MDRLKVLYVDKNMFPSLNERAMDEAEGRRGAVIRELLKMFVVVPEYDFDSRIVDKLSRDSTFNALVTHFPFNYNGMGVPSYFVSSANFIYLRQNLPQFPVVIYTGGNIIRELPSPLISTRIVEKSRFPDKDAKSILSNLEELIFNK